MCVGEKRTLVLGPDYGYGMAGAGHQANSEDQTPTPLIPGGATLRFTTELIGINMLVGAAVASAERDALVLYGRPVPAIVYRSQQPTWPCLVGSLAVSIAARSLQLRDVCHLPR